MANNSGSKHSATLSNSPPRLKTEIVVYAWNDLGSALKAEADKLLKHTFELEEVEMGSIIGLVINKKNGRIISTVDLRLQDAEEGEAEKDNKNEHKKKTTPNKETWICNVVTRPEYRRHGYSRALLMHIIEWWKNSALAEKSKKVLKLDVWQSKTAAVKLYKSLGFTMIGEYQSKDPASGKPCKAFIFQYMS